MSELLQFIQRRANYLTELENYMEILLIVTTVIFAIAGQASDCFCLRGYAWQLGALAVFLAWIGSSFVLKEVATDWNTHYHVAKCCIDFPETDLFACHPNNSICSGILFIVH